MAFQAKTCNLFTVMMLPYVCLTCWAAHSWFFMWNVQAAQFLSCFSKNLCFWWHLLALSQRKLFLSVTPGQTQLMCPFYETEHVETTLNQHLTVNVWGYLGVSVNSSSIKQTRLFLSDANADRTVFIFDGELLSRWSESPSRLSVICLKSENVLHVPAVWNGKTAQPV